MAIGPCAIAEREGRSVDDHRIGEDLPDIARRRKMGRVDARPGDTAPGVLLHRAAHQVHLHLGGRRPFGQFIDQQIGDLHHRLGGGAVHFLPQLVERIGQPLAHVRRAGRAGGRAARALARLRSEHAMDATPVAPGRLGRIFGQLRMGAGNMIALVERLDRDLPVARKMQPLAPAIAHLLQLERVEHRCRRLQIVTQRRRVRVHADEHPAAPCVDTHVAQPQRIGLQAVAPGILADDADIIAVQIPAPGMEGADQPLRIAAPFGQLPAAMAADVEIGGNPVGRGAHDDDRVIDNVISDIVADLRDFLFPAGDLPDFGP